MNLAIPWWRRAGWLIAAVCVACGTTRVSTPSPPLALDSQERLCVMLPADGRFGATVYFGSGQIVGARIAQVLRRQFRFVRYVQDDSEEKAVKSCQKDKGKFLIVPTLVRWEDHPTAWSMSRDQVEIALVLRALDGGEPRKVTFEARQTGGLHMSDQPAEELLGNAFEDAVLRLVGQAPQPAR
jgi:hypothetical protein